jgi:hypothetical protein
MKSVVLNPTHVEEVLQLLKQSRRPEVAKSKQQENRLAIDDGTEKETE